jgi:hypothetical protein
MNVHLPFSFKQQPTRRQDQEQKEDNRKLKHLEAANDLIEVEPGWRRLSRQAKS